MSKNDVNIFIGAVDKTKAAFKSVLGALTKIRTGASKMSAAMKKGFSIASRAVAGLTATFAGAVVEAVRYNQQMSRAWTMMGGGVKQFAAMRSEVKKLSQEFGIAKSELADGLYNALSAGVPENNVIGFLSDAAKVAVADGSDISVAVDGITTVLNAFKIPVEKTKAVLDTMFVTVKKGKLTFAELAQNMATAGPLAASMGIGFEEILAAVATLTKQGTPTAQAFTQIRAAMIGTNKVLGDGWRKTRTFQEAMLELGRISGGSQNGLKNMIGRIEGVNAVLGLTGINASMAAADIAEFSNSGGSLQGAFEKRDIFRHWNKSLESFRSLIDSVGEQLDKKLAPVVTRIAKKINGLANNESLWQSFADGYDKYAAPVLAQLEGLLDPATRSKSATNLKNGLVAIGLDFGDAVMRVLKLGVPRLGDALGRSIKEGMTSGVFQDRTDRMVAKQQLKQRGQWEGRGWTRTSNDARKARNEAKLDQFVKKMREDSFAAKGEQLAGQSSGSRSAQWLSSLSPSIADGSGSVSVTNSAPSLLAASSIASRVPSVIPDAGGSVAAASREIRIDGQIAVKNLDTISNDVKAIGDGIVRVKNSVELVKSQVKNGR